MLRVGGCQASEGGGRKYLIEKDDGEVVAVTFDRGFAEELCELVNSEMGERARTALEARQAFRD